MKKILFSISIIAAAAAVITGGTLAFFSDTETSTGNTFTAGTLDLNLDGGNINVVKFTVINAYPGQSGTGYWTIKNVGSLDGFVDIQPILVTNDENGCGSDSETAVDADCATGGSAGELSANMNVELFVDFDHDGVLDSGDGDVDIYPSGLLSAIGAGFDSNVALNAGAWKYISMNWSVLSGATNNIQSDKVTVDLTFELGQTTGQ